MIMNNKRKSGITLIALIVTIIVLLILAGVSISMIVGENGVVSKAQNAKRKSEETQAKEEIEMAIGSAWTDYNESLVSDYTAQLSNYLNETNMRNKYLKDGSGTIETISLENDGSGTISYKIKGTENVYNFAIDKDGNVTKIANNELNIEIGEKVYYNEGTGYTSTVSNSFTLEDLDWVYFGTNDFGQIQLISSNPTTQSFTIPKGTDGYINGVSNLNNLCNDLYGNGAYALYARSLNVEDIAKLAGITSDEQKKSFYDSYGDTLTISHGKVITDDNEVVTASTDSPVEILTTRYCIPFSSFENQDIVSLLAYGMDWSTGMYNESLAYCFYATQMVCYVMGSSEARWFIASGGLRDEQFVSVLPSFLYSTYGRTAGSGC